MASETTTTSANDIYLSAYVTDRILDEARPYNVMRPFFRTESGSRNSSAVDFPIQADPGAAGASYTEGTGLSNTQLTTDKATATAVSTGFMATLTDELVENSIIDAYPHFGRVLVRSVMERFETDGTALIDDFANTTGTSGVATTWATLIEAHGQLAQRDQTGSAVFVLDPAQVNNVRLDVGTSGAALFGSGSIDINGLQAETLGGYAGFSVGNAPVFQTTLVTSSGGAVFLADVALGLYEIRPIRTETERDASLPGTEIVVTTRYGMIEVRDVAGETIVSS